METFITELGKQLNNCITHRAEKYAYSVEHIPGMLERFRNAIQHNAFDKEGDAFKATCKALKIKHTYKAIKEFIANNK